MALHTSLKNKGVDAWKKEREMYVHDGRWGSREIQKIIKNDRDSQSFLYRHYDMEAEESNGVSIDLIELLETGMGEDFVEAVRICNMFNVPVSDIKACQEEILKGSD